MSVELKFDFDDEINYTFDDTKIEIVSGKAQLKLCSGGSQQVIEDFVSDTGFTYDSDKAEFAGGKVQQKDMRLGATFGANYNTDIDGNWGDGVLTGTAFAGAHIDNNKLDVSGGGYVDYDAVLNADSIQKGCIRCKITPNYTGIGLKHSFFMVSKSDIDTTNKIELTQWHNGQMKLTIFDKNNVVITSVLMAIWSPTAGQEYEFELDWNITDGETRLFIDGIQHGATIIDTGERDNDIHLLRVGTTDGAFASDCLIDDLVVFSDVQHTANYTKGYTIEDYIYVTSIVTLPQFSYPGLGNLQSFSDLINIETGIPHYIFDGKYWNGIAWFVSDNSYSQSNTYAVAKVNINSLTAVNDIIIKIVFPDSNIQSNVNNLILEYTGQVYPTDNPPIAPNTFLYIDGLEGFSNIISSVGNVNYILEKDNVKYYWNGSDWVISDGTYAQSNTATEIETNKAIFTDEKVKFKVSNIFLNSDGSQLTYIDILTILYNFAGDEETEVNKCIVYCYIDDILGEDYNGQITVRLNKSVVKYKTDKSIIRENKPIPVTDGYWEAELVENENMETGSYYIFVINGKEFRKKVPNNVYKNFYDLLDVY